MGCGRLNLQRWGKNVVNDRTRGLLLVLNTRGILCTVAEGTCALVPVHRGQCE